MGLDRSRQNFAVDGQVTGQCPLGVDSDFHSLSGTKVRYELKAKDIDLLANLSPGQKTFIGRDSRYIQISEGEVSRTHATLERGADGTLLITDGVNGVNSTNGTFVRSPGSIEWRRIAQAYAIQPGDCVRLGGVAQLRFPPKAAYRPFNGGERILPGLPSARGGCLVSERQIARSGRSQIISEGQEQINRVGRIAWQGPDAGMASIAARISPRVKSIAIERGKNGGMPITVTLDSENSNAVDYLKIVNRALKKNSKENGSWPSHLREVLILPAGELGRFLKSDGSIGRAVESFGIDIKGRLIVTEDAVCRNSLIRTFQKKCDFGTLLTLAEARAELIASQKDKPIRNWTVYRQQRARSGGNFRLPRDSDEWSRAPNGFFATNDQEWSILGRNTERFAGSILPGIGEGDYARPDIVINHSDLHPYYVRFKNHLKTGMNSLELISAAHLEAFESMKYDLGCDSAARQNVAYRQGGLPRSVTSLSLVEYLKIKRGVCEHKTAYFGYLLEQLKTEGLLSGSYSYQAATVEQPDESYSAHAWVRYESERGEIVYIDSAVKDGVLFLDEYQAGLWIYLTNEDFEILRSAPIS